MIRKCTDVDIAAIEAIINEAAQAYRGVIPTDCWHEPYMPRSDLMAEIAAGVAFWGWEDVGTLVGRRNGSRANDKIVIVRGAPNIVAGLLFRARPKGACGNLVNPTRIQKPT